MRESGFQKEVVQSFKLHGGDAAKLPDVPRSAGLRFIPDKPYDITATFDGLSYAIECKKWDKIKAFKTEELRESQHKGLSSWEKGGAVSLVFLNLRSGLGYGRISRLYYWRYPELMKLLEIYNGVIPKSVVEAGKWIPQDIGCTWNVKEILDDVLNR